MKAKHTLDRADVEERVRAALDTLLEQDGFLLFADVNERSITHRLAMYLQSLFPEWNVDCEYNRDGHDPKELDLPVSGANEYDTDATTVYPDIIVHKRDSQNNLLVIEAKKSTSSRRDIQFDLVKLEQYRRQLRYEHALFVEFVTAVKPPTYHLQSIT
jgi:hypothetical protein